MTAFCIEDLAQAIIGELASIYEHDPTETGVDIIGLLVGETTNEEVMTERGADRARERPVLRDSAGW